MPVGEERPSASAETQLPFCALLQMWDVTQSESLCKIFFSSRDHADHAKERVVAMDSYEATLI